METTLNSKKNTIATLFTLLLLTATTAQIGINTTTPSAGSLLDVSSTDKGILIPRVDIIDLTTIDPIAGGSSESLLVYNTNTTTGKGFYYWNGTIWVGIDGDSDWTVNGNKSTSPGTGAGQDFIGTSDNQNLIIATNNTERMRLLNDGRVTINNNTPNSGDRFTVTGVIDDWAINGYSSGTGIGIYGEASGTGLGVYGYSASNHGVYGTTAYTGGAFLTGGAIGWGTGDNGANGVLAITDKISSSKSNMGIRAVSGSTTSISSSEILNVAVNANATDLALYAISEGPITSVGDMEAARFQTNYTGDAITADGRDPRAELAGFTNNSLVGGNNMYYGGYFYSGGVSSGASYAYAGARYGSTNYKIIGNGNVSTIVEGIHRDDAKKIMFAPETPEVLFEDYGIGQLINGIGQIAIDPIFANNITVNNEHPLKVFIQLEGNCKGVFVTNKTATGFTVIELQNGSSNVSFSWHIVANRKNEIGRNSNEETIYADLRFPDAPSEIISKENRKIIIKESLEKEKSRLNKIK